MKDGVYRIRIEHLSTGLKFYTEEFYAKEVAPGEDFGDSAPGQAFYYALDALGLGYAMKAFKVDGEHSTGFSFAMSQKGELVMLTPIILEDSIMYAEYRGPGEH